MKIIGCFIGMILIRDQDESFIWKKCPVAGRVLTDLGTTYPDKNRLVCFESLVSGIEIAEPGMDEPPQHTWLGRHRTKAIAKPGMDEPPPSVTTPGGPGGPTGPAGPGRPGSPVSPAN